MIQRYQLVTGVTKSLDDAKPSLVEQKQALPAVICQSLGNTYL